MSAVLAEIVAISGRDRATDPGHMRDFYIAHPDTVRCSLALDEGGTDLGFQSLKRAPEGNPYGVTPGWGIIGTYVSPSAGRRGIGSALFAASVEAARQSGLTHIDATIGEANERALGYYEAMGFRTYRRMPGAICRCCVVDPRGD
jgi:ribosomal protein S18 acetylase RimI-like enzyme